MQLAQALIARGRPATVINADSAQVYADLTHLSARPTTAEMHGVPHRLFGEWDGAQACSAEEWAVRARAVIDEVHDQGGVPILVGGTGLYLRTLLDGIAPVPAIDAGVRAAVRALPVVEGYAALQGEDPDRAAVLNPKDTTRIARALEVIRSTGRTMTAWQADRVGGIGDRICLHALVLLPPRDWLYQRCDQRFDLMLERGAIAEVERLLARNLDPRLPVMRAIGVPEIGSYLAGECALNQAQARGAQATRNYAKRQYTWFRNQPPSGWSRNESKDCDIKAIFASLLQL